MRPARRWTLQVVVTLHDASTGRAALELRLRCWLEHVERLIARHDTPRETVTAPGPAGPVPAAWRSRSPSW